MLQRFPSPEAMSSYQNTDTFQAFTDVSFLPVGFLFRVRDPRPREDHWSQSLTKPQPRRAVCEFFRVLLPSFGSIACAHWLGLRWRITDSRWTSYSTREYIEFSKVVCVSGQHSTPFEGASAEPLAINLAVPSAAVRFVRMNNTPTQFGLHGSHVPYL